MSLLKKNKLVFIFTVMALLAIGVGYGYQYIFMSPKKVVEITPEFTADANEFNSLIDENLPSWIGKVVQISGKATQISQDGILLNGSIYCQFENSQDIQSITKNQNIVIKGKLVGFDELLMETKLNQCIIIQ